jgi:hypothetical protein
LKYYKLIFKDNPVPVAVSNDKWLLELYLVQRNLKKKDCSIYQLEKKEKYNHSESFLVYYYGYAVTSFEYRYICSLNAEYESDIYFQIYDLSNTLNIYKEKLSKKERKCLKESIKILEKLDVSKDMDHIRHTIDTVINRPGMVVDYLENMDMFRQCMEG